MLKPLRKILRTNTSALFACAFLQNAKKVDKFCTMSKRPRNEDEQHAARQEFLNGLKFSAEVKSLNGLSRAQCPTCEKNRRYYCYTCMKPMPSDTVKMPQITLPLHVVVYVFFFLVLTSISIQHPKEHKSKSSAIHAKVIAPDHTQIFEFPNIPKFLEEEPESAVLLYPTKDAISVEQVVQKLQNQALPAATTTTTTTTTADASKPAKPLKYVVFIDSTWQQSKSILRDPRMLKIPRVKISSHKTLFWRYQNLDETFLATIEAIYFFFREFSIYNYKNQEYNGEYDDLLFLFAFNYSLIQEHYEQHPELSFNHIDNYIAYKKQKTE